MTLLNAIGGDFEFQGIKLYNPTITEIGEKINDEDDFFFAIKLLSSSLMSFIPGDIPQNFSDFDILFALFYEGQNNDFNLFSKDKIKAIKELFLLLFKGYNISIGKEEFIFSKDKTIFILNSSNFQEFQNIIKEMFKISFLFDGEGSEQSYNPATEAARKIAEKLKKSREKITELNGKKHTTALIENYIMIVATGLCQNPQVLADTLTLYQLLTIFIRVKMKLEWDLDIKCRLAGGTPEEHPEQWMSII